MAKKMTAKQREQLEHQQWRKRLKRFKESEPFKSDLKKFKETFRDVLDSKGNPIIDPKTGKQVIPGPKRKKKKKK